MSSGGRGAGGGGRGPGNATGTATGAGTRVGVQLKLSQLQNLCKRDPQGYREDYEAQVRRLESELGILALQGNSSSTSIATTGGAVVSFSTSSASSSDAPHKRLEELIQFAAAVSSSSYKGAESDRIATVFMSVLVGNPISLHQATAAAAASSSVGAPASPSASSQSSTRTVNHVIAMPSSALRLPKDVRRSLVSGLILMRNKGAVEPLRLLELFFRIMVVVPDKSLREMLHRHIVNDIRNVNKGKVKRNNDAVNRSIMAFFHRVVGTHGQVEAAPMDEGEAATEVAAKRATDMVCELYRRRVWTCDRTVAIIASACLSRNVTVMCRALRFFLQIEDKMADDDARKREEEVDGSNRIDFHSHSRKTHARQRHVKRQLKRRKKAIESKKEDADWADVDNPDRDRGVEVSKKLYPAIELLRDPQGLAEAVFKRLKSSAGSYKYEVKLLMMNFVTRLVGNHQLLILPLYSFLAKYLSGHQRDVTAVLAYSVQACHEHVPPDEAYGLLKTIAHNFITERCSEEQMAVGINAARAICARVPSVMSEEEGGIGGGGADGDIDAASSTVAMDIEAFARDLAAFANHRDRSVGIAGKAWQNFVRETNPGLLQGKHRGLKGTALKKSGIKPLRYGEHQAAAGVAGADLLVEYESKKKAAAAARRKSKGQGGNEGEAYDDDEWEDVPDGDDDAEADGDGDDDSSAPDLVLLEGDKGEQAAAAAAAAAGKGDDEVVDVSKMTPEERDALKQKVSSTRIFTASDFAKMKKLVEREERAKRDPREAARRKRAIAKTGQDFEELSGDDDGGGTGSDSDGSEDDDEERKVRVTGAVNPGDIMAEAKRKRQSKAERLEKIIAGRSQFESKKRPGGSTNVEKKRKKNFLMTKFSGEARTKRNGKGGLRKKRDPKLQNTHEKKKRRRKL